MTPITHRRWAVWAVPVSGGSTVTFPRQPFPYRLARVCGKIESAGFLPPMRLDLVDGAGAPVTTIWTEPPVGSGIGDVVATIGESLPLASMITGDPRFTTGPLPDEMIVLPDMQWSVSLVAAGASLWKGLTCITYSMQRPPRSPRKSKAASVVVQL